MTRPTVTRRACSVAALAGVVLAAAAPGAAGAATVSPQAELRAPARFPAALPGGFKRGERIPRGFVLLRRRVALGPRDGDVAVRFRCPGRRKIRTLGLNDPSDVGIRLPAGQRGYDRRSRVTLVAYRSPLVGDGETARGRLYVLCRRR
jgi:hypothetical protein